MFSNIDWDKCLWIRTHGARNKERGARRVSKAPPKVAGSFDEDGDQDDKE
jgi:hypothetical protein